LTIHLLLDAEIALPAAMAFVTVAAKLGTCHSK
jgi:hypothetical protein